MDSERLLAGELQEIRPGENVMFKPHWSTFHRMPLGAHLTALGVAPSSWRGATSPTVPGDGL